MTDRNGWVLVDLDGTLCDCRHRAELIHKGREGGPDWEAYSLACEMDSPITGVIRMVELLGQRHYICLISGRSDVATEQTKEWLAKYTNIPYTMLWMRKEGDRRDNVTIKLEAATKLTTTVNEVILVVDDYPAVVDAFLERGIQAMLVARDGCQ